MANTIYYCIEPPKTLHDTTCSNLPLRGDLYYLRFPSHLIQSGDLNPLSDFFMMNELAWQHETNWIATRGAPPVTNISDKFNSSQSRFIQFLFTLCSNLYKLILTAAEMLQTKWEEVWTTFSLFSLGYFCLLVNWMMLLEGLCCHLVYFTYDNITVYRQVFFDNKQMWFALHSKGPHPNVIR